MKVLCLCTTVRNQNWWFHPSEEKPLQWQQAAATVECLPLFNCHASDWRLYVCHLVVILQQTACIESEVKKLFGEGIDEESKSAWRIKPLAVTATNGNIGKEWLCIDYSQTTCSLFSMSSHHRRSKILSTSWQNTGLTFAPGLVSSGRDTPAPLRAFEERDGSRPVTSTRYVLQLFRKSSKITFATERCKLPLYPLPSDHRDTQVEHNNGTQWKAIRLSDCVLNHIGCLLNLVKAFCQMHCMPHFHCCVRPWKLGLH